MNLGGGSTWPFCDGLAEAECVVGPVVDCKEEMVCSVGVKISANETLKFTEEEM